MKKSILILGIVGLFLASCGGGDETTETTTYTPPPKPAASKSAGEVLIAKSDCIGCHRLDSKLIGPSYQDIAAKYKETDIEAVAGRIVSGSKGIWGSLPMTPHPKITQDEAKEIVKYILSLKK